MARPSGGLLIPPWGDPPSRRAFRGRESSPSFTRHGLPVGSLALAMEGRDLMLRGRDAEAPAKLSRSYAASPFPPVAIWAAELERKAGRLERASRYLLQVAPAPWVGLPLGQVYEAMGEPEKARAAYAWVVEGWDEADPFLQPRVVEARGALARLEGLQRG